MEEETKPDLERLSRFLAHAGIASRRRAEELIEAGRVRVNGTVVTTQGFKLDPVSDRVTLDGKPVRMQMKQVYLALYKPRGYICTAQDPHGRPIILDLLPREVRRLRVYPVGRLDLDTSGLLLLTNDGNFSMRLSHPRYGKEKEYQAFIEGYPSRATLERLRTGVRIQEDSGEWYKTHPARVEVLSRQKQQTWLSLTIQEGRKRQLRRMLESVGHPVHELVRVRVGSLSLAGLHVGEWRYLVEEEVQALLQKM